MMFQLIFFSILSFSTHLNSQKTIKIDYHAQGEIIQLDLDGNLITTDKNSVFQIPDAYDDFEYAHQIKGLISASFRNGKRDTVKFEGSFIPFDKEAERTRKWSVGGTVLDLIKVNRASIIDKSGQEVKIIKVRVKTFGKKKKGYYLKARIYYNRHNGIELMREIIKIRTGTPKF